MIPVCKYLIGATISVLLLLTGLGLRILAAEKPELLVAISLDIPPFVLNEAAGGLEVDIVRQALADYSLRFVQIPYEELQTAVQNRKADVSIGVQPNNDAVYYSADFINFANYAISKKAEGLHINNVADLRDHPVLTWENAYLELGPEFETMFSPQSPQRKYYIEVADQKEQVRKFWAGQGQIIVIDRSIFDYFSRGMGHDLAEVSYHAVFPPVTNFKAAFRNGTVRDRFNESLDAMCKSGAYAELLHQYDVVVKRTVCE